MLKFELYLHIRFIHFFVLQKTEANFHIKTSIKQSYFFETLLAIYAICLSFMILNICYMMPFKSSFLSLCFEVFKIGLFASKYGLFCSFTQFGRICIHFHFLQQEQKTSLCPNFKSIKGKKFNSKTCGLDKKVLSLELKNAIGFDNSG